MTPHVQRVVEECEALKEKISKLTAFIDSKTFEELDVAQRRLFQWQFFLMDQYRKVLEYRISDFEVSA